MRFFSNLFSLLVTAAFTGVLVYAVMYFVFAGNIAWTVITRAVFVFLVALGTLINFRILMLLQFWSIWRR